MTSTLPAQKTAQNVVLGTMTFGEPGVEGARVDNVQDIEAILDVFLKHGHREIDTARVYGRGSSERMLGKISHKEKGLLIETKIIPFNSFLPDVSAAHTLEGLRKAIMTSLKALNTDKLEIWYLHAPDRSVPYEVTLKAIDELYREGHFKRWGMSHYVAWEVAEIVGICKQHGYVLPSVYQGIYNAIHRDVELELFPALRKFGIAFYEFNPLAGGLLTDRYTSVDNKAEKGSRLDPDGMAGKAYRARYWKPVFFDALSEVRIVMAAHGLTMAEVALRWVSHHSLLRRESGDAILIGGSNLQHIEANLIDLEKGPLPAEVLTALDEAWGAVKAHSSGYHSYPSLRKS
ncbi:Aflatoxin B1 aldehyde reductase member 3 [Mycena venus]|uniref:Aflatoxin B1 aldehyde reductase member 3 n=1 Tax=Mycena venus TaxID=2733690 RepID=A0A8H7CRF2_9AGAR|nr:Aflatoxin B1 aldehyde reductase member 3 [Mycena venus]